jgi:SAM-dependent methyltransferase
MSAVTALSPHKRAVREHFDRLAPAMDRWRRKSWYYHQELQRTCRAVIPEGSAVIELGCGGGDLLAALAPREGLGVDLSPAMIERARGRFPGLEWAVGDAEAVETLAPGRSFDYVVLSDLLGHLEDIWATFRGLHRVVRPDSRVVITYYSYLWEPVLSLAERLGQRIPLRLQNWLTLGDIENLLALSEFEVVKRGHRFLVPKRVPLVSDWMNRVVARLPLVSRLGLVEYVVARPRRPLAGRGRSAADLAATVTTSVIVPCRNERGNVDAAVARLPPLGAHTEIIFVDGASTDGTRERIVEVIDAHRGEKDIKLVLQDSPSGKGDAVRRGFDRATGDVLMILDADLTVDPEDLPKFLAALLEGQGELVMGSRLVYPMERQAMRFANLLGNKAFSRLFSWILEQRITDTLCGTKALRQSDYRKIEAHRAFFGDFDPFGDFDLIFGAARLNLRIVEIPVRYRDRVYGTTKISRWRHGVLLCRMSWLGLRRLRFE